MGQSSRHIETDVTAKAAAKRVEGKTSEGEEGEDQAGGSDEAAGAGEGNPTALGSHLCFGLVKFVQMWSLVGESHASVCVRVLTPL